MEESQEIKYNDYKYSKVPRGTFDSIFWEWQRKKNRGLSSSRKEPSQPVPGGMLGEWAWLLGLLKLSFPNLLQLALAISLHGDLIWRKKCREGECQLEVPRHRVHMDLIKKEKKYQVWGTTAELLRLESKRTVDLNSTSYTFILPSLQRDSFWDCSTDFTSYSFLQYFTSRFNTSLRALESCISGYTLSFWWSKMMHLHNVK